FLDDGTPVLSHDFDEKNENSVQLDSAFNLLFPYSIKINLDMKETHYIDKVASLIEFYSLDDRSFLTGITEDKVEQVKSLAPNIDFYLNIKIPISKKYNVSYINEIGEKAKALGAIGINLHHSNITKESVSLWHSQGLLVSVYTANSAFDINVALYKNVDNITTLKPLRAVKNLKNL
ncbi:MAG TPA: glycerophosphodiester phosphodiesterase, partial [Clostridia bacterium]|nr:glycerophosphodiester phosphodiesterase [Clostridia bacterium]